MPNVAPTMHAANPRERTFRWIALGADIAVIASVLVMVILYRAQREDAEEVMRRGTTVDLIALRYEDRILMAERNLNDYMIESEDMMVAIEFATDDEPAPDVILASEIRADYVLMVDFYTDIISCRETGQCEPALVDQWFKDDICQFQKNASIIGFPQLQAQYGAEFLLTLRDFSSRNCA